MIRGFRVWDNQTKSYDFDTEFVLSSSGELMELRSKHNCIWEYHFADTDRFIVEFETGLKDKNGKEIYEGDIIQCGAMVGVVTMFEDLACWCIGQNPIWSTLLIEKDADGDLVLPTTFIISNIHENPELVGGKE